MIFDADIKQSAVIDGKGIYLVDEKDQTFIFLPDGSIWPLNIDSKPGCRKDWCFIGQEVYCRGTQGRILWCDPVKLDWKEVKGLEELQEYLIGWRNRCGLSKIKVMYPICKLCCNSAAGNIVIFWNSQNKDAESLDFGLPRFLWRDVRETRFGERLSGTVLSSVYA
ncbi:unnamed protein product [Arabis nemorensis]|uniref:Uncharacterized protein n=1 Tax=Arabis nemorensis TaxID=586526 RepID=A0A565C8H0_9BRAS|nr:unnamed protein product [Arabis nemorensis]